MTTFCISIFVDVAKGQAPRETLHQAGFLGVKILAMTRIRLLLAQLAVLAPLLGVVLYGLAHAYLWDVLWYSAIAHTLGGLWAILFFLWAQNMLRLSRNLTLCVAAVLVLGILWEIFEFLIGATHFPADTFDTAADLIMDMIGGMIGVRMMRYL